MLIISRPRHNTDHTATALRLTAKFNANALNIPFLYDLPADSPILERLRCLPEPACFLIPLAQRAATNLLDYLQIPYAEVFETEDAVQLSDGGVQGGYVEYLDDVLVPRWYPVIDQTRCIACLECVNYCLSGVYSIGNETRPFVCHPNSCRDGCPACARICPNGAIIFPLYEDRVISGYELRQPDNL